jgi:hypothetical protein
VSNWSLELKKSQAAGVAGLRKKSDSGKHQDDGFEMHQTDISHLGVEMVRGRRQCMQDSEVRGLRETRQQGDGRSEGDRCGRVGLPMRGTRWCGRD